MSSFTNLNGQLLKEFLDMQEKLKHGELDALDLTVGPDWDKRGTELYYAVLGLLEKGSTRLKTLNFR